jgi:hypothetical protein
VAIQVTCARGIAYGAALAEIDGEPSEEAELILSAANPAPIAK